MDDILNHPYQPAVLIDAVLGFSSKPATTKVENGRITSKEHSSVGEELTRTFLSHMTNEGALLDEVVPLVSTHLAPMELFKAGAGNTAVRRLARRVGRIDRLVRVAHADMLGRPPLQVDTFDAGEWLTERARALEVEAAAPKPIVMGRHLIQLGLKPGTHAPSLKPASTRKSKANSTH